jgi:hypothetical protein
MHPSEGQAAIAAGGISARIRGAGESAHYDGRGACYLEFGHNQAAKVDVTFVSGQMPHGTLEGPSPALVADKADFGSVRIQRWFGRASPESTLRSARSISVNADAAEWSKPAGRTSASSSPTTTST